MGQGKLFKLMKFNFGRRKYNGWVVEGQCFFGGICCKSRIFFFFFYRTCAETLTSSIIKFMKEHSHPGTTAISDCWRAFKCLQKEGYQHSTVNNLYNYVDPDTKAHANTMEGRQSQSVPRFGRKYHYVGYLARTVFTLPYPDQNKRFHQFLPRRSSSVSSTLTVCVIFSIIKLVSLGTKC